MSGFGLGHALVIWHSSFPRDIQFGRHAAEDRPQRAGLLNHAGAKAEPAAIGGEGLALNFIPAGEQPDQGRPRLRERVFAEAVAKARAEGRIVLVDFTAK